VCHWLLTFLLAVLIFDFLNGSSAPICQMGMPEESDETPAVIHGFQVRPRSEGSMCALISATPYAAGELADLMLRRCRQWVYA